MKQQNAAAKQEQQEQPEKKLSAKEAALERALAMEEADEAVNGASEDEEPKLSKKELKALKKKEEKMAAKLAKKQEKKDAAKQEEVEVVAESPVNGEVAEQVRCCYVALTLNVAKMHPQCVSHWSSLIRHHLPKKRRNRLLWKKRFERNDLHLVFESWRVLNLGFRLFVWKILALRFAIRKF